MTDGFSLRERGALLLGRLAAAATQRLGRGGGTALPGLVATRAAPGLTAALARRAAWYDSPTALPQFGRWGAGGG